MQLSIAVALERMTLKQVPTLKTGQPLNAELLAIWYSFLNAVNPDRYASMLRLLSKRLAPSEVSYLRFFFKNFIIILVGNVLYNFFALILVHRDKLQQKLCLMERVFQIIIYFQCSYCHIIQLLRAKVTNKTVTYVRMIQIIAV